jgi:cation diffusion facilitator CzcD-associated flavoprotein CzcO
MSATQTVEVEHVRVAVIGAGLAGVAAGVALKNEGIEDFVILERADDVGGVWRANTYPGVACDIPSHLYSYSYAPSAEWRHTFARGSQIHSYIRSIATDNGLTGHVRLGQELLDASWDDELRRWAITTTDLELTTDILVDATGPLTEPQIPDIEGLAGFDGTIFHSARWDHDHDLGGERVAVVGTGASSIQLVPEIQRRAEQVTVFQRTPGWVIPRFDRATTAAERGVLRLIPSAARLQRLVQFLVRDGLHYRLIRRNRTVRAIIEGIARAHLRRHVRDPELRAKLTPDFEIGCKRILISNDWYPALAEPNVEVVAGGVREIRGRTIIASDGSEHEVDTIILGTGFEVMPPPVTERITGREQRSLAEVWRGALRHYRAVEVAGFPNYFRLAGVGCGLGHGSMIFQIESQTAYLRDVLRAMARHDASSVEVSQQAQDEYMRFAAADVGRTVWALGGCKSWYQDEHGEATSMWPRSMWSYRRLMRTFEPADHVIHTADLVTPQAPAMAA